MSEGAIPGEAGGVDPLKTVADAMMTAVQAAKDGATDAKESVAKSMPAVTEFLSRLVYTTCYTVSYGVTFPTYFVASVVPKNNALVHGFVDGAAAARDTVSKIRNQTPAEAISTIASGAIPS